MGGERPGPEVRRSAEILFEARIRADELRFEAAPANSVEFTGDASDESASGSDRTNLPDQVVEKTTYRDVQIDYAIAAKLAADPPEGDQDDKPESRGP